MATQDQIVAAIQAASTVAASAPAASTEAGSAEASVALLAGLTIDLPADIASASQPIVDAINAAAAAIVAAVNAVGSKIK